MIQLSDKEGNVYHKKPTAVKWIGCIWLYNLFTSYEFMAMGVVCAMNMCTLLLLFLVIRIIEWFKSFFLVDSGQYGATQWTKIMKKVSFLILLSKIKGASGMEIFQKINRILAILMRHFWVIYNHCARTIIGRLLRKDWLG